MDYGRFSGIVRKLDGNINFITGAAYKNIAANIGDNETVMAVFDGLSPDGQFAAAVTNESFCYSILSGLFSKKEARIPISKIGTVGRSGGLIQKITIAEGAILHEIPFIRGMQKIVDALNNAIRTQQDNGRSHPVTAAEKSAADEIRKFKALLDEGIINQEEFEAKKKSLLGI